MSRIAAAVSVAVAAALLSAGAAGAGRAAPAQPAKLPRALVAAWQTIATDEAANTRYRWTFTIYPDAQFTFSIGTWLFFDDGRITVHGNRIAFAERVAQGERCAGAQRIGTYTWKIAARKLTLTPLKDSCLWRRAILTAQPLAWSAR